MSVYRDKRSPYWSFDFQIRGYRFSGSTGLENKSDAETFEKNEKAEARRLISRIADSAGAPLTIGHACSRWWNEHGQHLNDPDLKARLDWLVAEIGPRTMLHNMPIRLTPTHTHASILSLGRSRPRWRGRCLMIN